MMNEEIEELRKDKARLDWRSTSTDCEPMLSTRYDGVQMWRYMGIWYDSLRAAIDAAMKGEKHAG